jgi:plasmid stabilization system protein ParE
VGDGGVVAATLEEPDHVDVWRVLHARRDISNLLRPPEPDEQA